ncbi:MAG: flagellar protein FlaG [Spirochaetaceae bacterium]|nr:MAG: flagellar protein FlaG [Spirochaetaceae bacterium]
MSIDMPGLPGYKTAVLRDSGLPRKATNDISLQAARAAANAAAEKVAAQQRQAAREPLLSDLEQVSGVFNHRLKLSVNNELDRVIVKIIDRDTDKVIKELPPAELQRVYSRIREAIGLLVDTEI